MSQGGTERLTSDQGGGKPRAMSQGGTRDQGGGKPRPYPVRDNGGTSTFRVRRLYTRGANFSTVVILSAAKDLGVR